MKKQWKLLQYQDCDRCGSDAVEVLTESKDDNTFYDQELVRCTECGIEGYTSVDGDEDDDGNCIGNVSWNDSENLED